MVFHWSVERPSLGVIQIQFFPLLGEVQPLHIAGARARAAIPSPADFRNSRLFIGFIRYNGLYMQITAYKCM